MKKILILLFTFISFISFSDSKLTAGISYLNIDKKKDILLIDGKFSFSTFNFNIKNNMLIRNEIVTKIGMLNVIGDINFKNPQNLSIYSELATNLKTGYRFNDKTELVFGLQSGAGFIKLGEKDDVLIEKLQDKSEDKYIFAYFYIPAEAVIEFRHSFFLVEIEGGALLPLYAIENKGNHLNITTEKVPLTIVPRIGIRLGLNF